MRACEVCLVSAAVMMFCCSCSKDSGVHQELSDYVIVFGEPSVTKASEVDGIMDDGFNVAAFSSSGCNMFCERAAYSSSLGAFSPVNGPYHYPASGTMRFHAVYPPDVPLTVTGAQVSVNYAQKDYTDILVATAGYVQATTSAVQLAFCHAMTQVHFRAAGKTDDVLYRLKSITLHVPSSGVYSFETGLWAADTLKISEYYLSQAVILPKDTGVMDLSGSLLIIPCEPVITVEWETYTLDKTMLLASYCESKPLGSVTAMSENSTITLYLPNDDATRLTLDVAVTPWRGADTDIEFEAD